MKSRFVPLVLFVLISGVSANAEDLNLSFKRVTDLVAQKNYSKALEELTWAKREIEKMQSTQLQTFLPDQLLGFSGGKVESSNALGFSNIERQYTKGQETVKISLSGGSGGANEMGLGNLAAIGKMAAMFGNQPGQETVRISGRTATFDKKTGGSGAELTVFLDSGSVLRLELAKGSNAEVLKELANAIKIDDLDKSLKG